MAPSPTGTIPEISAPLLVPPAEAAALLSVTRQTVYAMLNAGTLPSLKIGRCRRIPMQAIIDLIGGADAAA